MFLQKTRRNVRPHLARHGPVNDFLLGSSAGHQNDSFRLQNSRNPHGNGMSRDIFFPTKARSSINNGLARQGHPTSPAVHRTPLLIKANVALTSDPKELPINPSGSLNRRLILRCRLIRILRNRGRHRDVFGLHINVIEKIFPHLAPVASLMIATQALVFIQIKADHICERKPLLPVTADQFRIKREGRAARRQPQNHGLSFGSTTLHQSLNFISERATKFIDFPHLYLLRTNLNFFHVNRNSLLRQYVTTFDY